MSRSARLRPTIPETPTINALFFIAILLPEISSPLEYPLPIPLNYRTSYWVREERHSLRLFLWVPASNSFLRQSFSRSVCRGRATTAFEFANEKRQRNHCYR